MTLPEPARLPAAAEMVDSASLAAAVTRLAGAETAGHALLSLEFDANGWNARRDLIEHSLPPAVADSLQRLVFAHRRTVAAGDPWGVRLRVDLPGPVFRVGRREYCEAHPRDSQLLRGSSGPYSVTQPSAPDARWRTVWVHALVDTRGHVVEVEPAQSIGRRHELERLTTILRSVGFDPALLDGRPVPAWVRVPVYLP